MKRFGQIIQVKPEMLDKYKALHADPWPGVVSMIKDCNIQNYSIYHYGGFLFAYFEYTGTDYEADMAKMASDPETQRWWDECIPCQQPVEGAKKDEWWVNIQEVFHV